MLSLSSTLLLEWNSSARLNSLFVTSHQYSGQSRRTIHYFACIAKRDSTLLLWALVFLPIPRQQSAAQRGCPPHPPVAPYQLMPRRRLLAPRRAGEQRAAGTKPVLPTGQCTPDAVKRAGACLFARETSRRRRCLLLTPPAAASCARGTR